MASSLTKACITRIKKYLQLDQYEITKVIYLSLAFFFIIGSYSILRSLKTSIFLGFVGKEYQPIAKILSIVLMIPAMLAYSKLIDKLKRYQVVYFFLAFYACLGILFSLLFMHPVYGIKNTVTDAYRITGWSFEIFMDLYQAFIVGSLWSFINSVSTPDFANKSYGIIYAFSRIGGILSTALGLLLLSQTVIKDHHSIPLLTFLASLLLIGAALSVYKIMQKVPREHLYGYSDTHFKKDHNKTSKQIGILEGLKFILTEPYVFGIFGLVACFEITNIIFDYQMQVLMSIETHNNVQAMSRFMLVYTNSFQILSFIFALFGTSTLLKRFGVFKCLLVMPIVTLGLAFWLFLNPSLTTIFITMVVLRGLQYGFNKPVQEVLYVPTIKDIQFKSKAWIDSFGRTFSKSSGSVFNLFSILHGAAFFFGFQALITLTLSAIWFGISILIGKKYQKTVTTNALIGCDQDETIVS